MVLLSMSWDSESQGPSQGGTCALARPTHEAVLANRGFQRRNEILASSMTNRPRSERLPGTIFLIQENKVIAIWSRKCRCASSCCNPIKLMTKIVSRSSPIIPETPGVESGSRGTKSGLVATAAVRASPICSANFDALSILNPASAASPSRGR